MSITFAAPRSTLIGHTVTGDRIWLTERTRYTPQKWYQAAHCYIIGQRIELDRTLVAHYLRATKRYASTRSASHWAVAGY